MNVTVDAATNRLVGSTYDANGNLTVGSGLNLTYDISNRIATAAGPSAEWYSYAPGNKRVWKKRQTGGSTYEENVYFYSAGGQRLGTYTLTDASGTLALTVKSTNLYFGGKLIKEGVSWVAMDRLGSVRARLGDGLTTFDHFPYGEEKPSATAQDRNKFAAYFRDHTNLDYADNRYYTSGMGRFMTPDPAGESASTSGNMYSYAHNDPINIIDPSGLAPADIQSDDLGFDWGCRDSFTGVPTLPDASNQCPTGSLWFIAGGRDFGRSRLGRIRDLFDGLTELVLDWEYSNGRASVFDVTIDLGTLDMLVNEGLLGSNFVQVAIPYPQVVEKGLTIVITVAAGTLALISDWWAARKKKFPDYHDLVRDCVPGRLVEVPSISHKGGTSHEQEYICKDRSYTVHWITDANGKTVHWPHVRPDPPTGDGGAHN